MKQKDCGFEEKILAAERSGDWSGELRSHLAECATCEAVALAAGYLCASAEAAERDASVPDAGRLWRKAEAAANAEAIERALRPIVWAQRVACGVGGAALVAAMVMLWPWIAGIGGRLADFWVLHPAASESGHDSFIFLVMMVFLMVLPPLIFGIYSAWSEN